MTDSTRRVVAIHVAKGRRLPMRSVESVEAEAGRGLVGDRYHGAKHRHVTLQSATSLAEAEEAYGAPVPWAGTRRNLTVDTGVVPSRPGDRVRIGGEGHWVDLEVVRIAAPCRILDDEIGPGAAAALRRRAGSVLRLLGSGPIAVGDAVEW